MAGATRPGRWPVGRPARIAAVRGPSMSPALRDGDVVLVSAWARPRPGAVALVRWPRRPGQLSVKRIVGRYGAGWWVLGDNPRGSTDSRTLGSAVVVAVVVARLWPSPRRVTRRHPPPVAHPPRASSA